MDSANCTTVPTATLRALRQALPYKQLLLVPRDRIGLVFGLFI